MLNGGGQTLFSFFYLILIFQMKENQLQSGTKVKGGKKNEQEAEIAPAATVYIVNRKVGKQAAEQKINDAGKQG